MSASARGGSARGVCGGGSERTRLVRREGAIPLRLLPSVVDMAVGRLADKSSHVRQYSARLLTTLLRHNPFAGELALPTFEAELQRVGTVFKERMTEIRERAIETRRQRKQELLAQREAARKEKEDGKAAKQQKKGKKGRAADEDDEEDEELEMLDDAVDGADAEESEEDKRNRAILEAADDAEPTEEDIMAVVRWPWRACAQQSPRLALSGLRVFRSCPPMPRRSTS